MAALIAIRLPWILSAVSLILLATLTSNAQTNERFLIVVPPPLIESDDPIARVVADEVLQATLEHLREQSDLELIAPSAAEIDALVPPGLIQVHDKRLVRNALAYAYDNHYRAVIEIERSIDDENWLARLNLGASAARTTISKYAVIHGDGDVSGDDVDAVGARFATWIAESVGQHTAGEPVSQILIDRLLDSSQPDERRLNVLNSILGPQFDLGVRLAAIHLGTLAASDETRRRVWETLRHDIFEPALVPALATVLVQDPVEAVRLEAAAALAAYIRDPMAEQTLLSVQVSDSSAAVRLLARIALMEREQQLSLLGAIVQDRSLPLAERAAPVLLDNSMRPWRRSPSDELYVAYAEIAEIADSEGASEILDAAVRRLSSELTDHSDIPGVPMQRRANPNAYVVDVLLRIAEHADGQVRVRTLSALRMLRADPRAAAAVESLMANEAGQSVR